MNTKKTFIDSFIKYGQPGRRIPYCAQGSVVMNYMTSYNRFGEIVESLPEYVFDTRSVEDFEPNMRWECEPRLVYVHLIVPRCVNLNPYEPKT